MSSRDNLNAAPDATMVRRARAIWSGWSLARQFATCATLVLVPAMWIMGLWVSNRIQEGVTHRAGTAAALYMENFLEPLIQEMDVTGQLSMNSVSRLGSLLADNPSLGQRVYTFKVWGRGDVVMASSRPALVGQQFPPSPGLTGAWQGGVKAELDHLKEVENKFEKNAGIPLLEVYIPLRARGSDRIVAVGEFYEYASDLKRDLNKARWLSWLVVSSVTLSMLSALFAIVRRGSRTILEQRVALESRVDELTRLVSENQQLRSRIQRASARASQTNESYLQRLGADLHDGPAQLISLALMHLDEPVAPTSSSKQCGAFGRMVR